MRSTPTVSVIAGGWSFSMVPHELVPGHIISVNDSAYHLRRNPHEIVSMDRLWTEHRWEWLRQRRITTHLRRACLKNIKTMIARETVWLNIFDCDHESVRFADDQYGPATFSMYPNRLNGTNSGTCALNRAWLLRPKNLFLFGFDMQPGPNGEHHWHPPYPWADEWKTTSKKFTTWAREFDYIAEQFTAAGTQVWNVSDRSQIGVFSTLGVEDLKKLPFTTEPAIAEVAP